MISTWWLIPAIAGGALACLLALCVIAAWQMRRTGHVISEGESNIISMIERLQGEGHDKRLVVDSDVSGGSDLRGDRAVSLYQGDGE